MLIVIVGRGVPTIQYPLNGIFELDQARALAGVGHKVIYVAIDLRSIRRLRKFGKSNFIQDGVEIWNCNYPVGNVNDKFLAKIGEKCFSSVYKKIVKKHGKPDIIHAHFYDVAGYVAEFCKREKLKLVITEHSSQVNKDVLQEKFVARIKRTYACANALLAVGSSLACKIKKHTGFEPQVVHNVIDFKEFAGFDIEKTNSENFELVSAGNLLYGKGFDVLLKSFAQVVKKFPNMHLTIMGAGQEELSLKNLTTDLGLNDFVSFYGKFVRSEFARKLSNANAFVLASRGETFGVVYVEAMSMGVPVIATRCGGPEDFVNDSNGILAAVDDENELANAIEKIYLNASSYDKTVIKNNALERFSANSIAGQLTRVYESIR